MNTWYARMIVISVAMLLFTAPALSAMAASVEITPTVQAGFDKTAASADAKLKSSLQKLYNDFVLMQKQSLGREAQIKALHYRNQEAATVLRKQISLVDADKLSKLETPLKQTRSRYQPLFDQYQTLNQRISIASKLKNKEVTALLRTQAAFMKTAVTLARQDIRLKESAVTKAKEERSRKMKQLRAALGGIDPVNIKIRAEQSLVSSYKKQLASEWKYFTHAVKKADAARAADSLVSLNSIYSNINAHQLKIYHLEQSIDGIIAKVRRQLAAANS